MHACFYAVSKEQSCDIDFKISIDNHLMEKVIGAEIAIYKRNQTSKEHSYTVYIMHKVGEIQSQILDAKTVSMSEQGWQIFNIDAVAAQLQGPNNELTVQIAVKVGGTFFPCQSVKSMFVLKAQEETHTVMKNLTPAVTVFTTMVGSVLHCKMFPKECKSLQSSADPVQQKIGTQNRLKRDSVRHNYVLALLDQRKAWKEVGCVNASFNGQSISPHHCYHGGRVKMFCALEEGRYLVPQQWTNEIKYNHTACAPSLFVFC